MASIIRSPEISEEKRKLTTRRARAQEAPAPIPAPAPSAPPAQASVAGTFAPAPPAPVPSPVAAPAAAPDMKALLAKAREQIKAELQKEVEQAKEAARELGMKEGLAAGTEEARKAFEAELTRIRSVADKLHEAAAGNIKGIEELAVSIAFEAVCKMLGTAAVTKEGILALVQEASSHIVNAERLAVRLHPTDLAVLKETGSLDGLGAGADVSWIADQSIKLGGCVLETGSGELDARLETQIDRLRATLLAARCSAP